MRIPRCVSSLTLLGSMMVFAEAAAVAAVDTGAPARPVRPGIVTANVLNIRARPGQQYEVIGKFKKDDPVSVVGEVEAWYEVLVPPTVEAWIAGRFIDAENKITVDRVKVHSGPGAIFSIYGMVTKGDAVKKLGDPTADGWQKFEALPSLSAWVAREFVSVKAAADTAGGPAVAPGPAKPASIADATKPAPAPDTGTPATGGDQTEAATAAGADEAVITPPAPTPEKTAPVPAVADTKPKPAVGKISPVPAVPPKPAPSPTPVAKEGPVISDTLAGLSSGTSAATATAAGKGEPLAVPATVKGLVVGKTTVTRDGVLTALKDQASAAATHLLSKRVGNTLYPECYIILGKDTNAKLSDWEGRTVRAFGRELWYPNWKRPVLEVSGIESLNP